MILAEQPIPSPHHHKRFLIIISATTLLIITMMIPTTTTTTMIQGASSSHSLSARDKRQSGSAVGVAGCETWEGDEVGLGERKKLWLNSSCHLCSCSQSRRLSCLPMGCDCDDVAAEKADQCCEACSEADAGCRNVKDQSIIKGLKPGRRLQRKCLVCFCWPSGDAQCGQLKCPVPKCSNPVIPEGGCCRRCLKSSNQALMRGTRHPQ